MEIQEEKNLCQDWAKITEDNIERFFTEFFLENLQDSIRQNMVQLLNRLWLKGNDQKKIRLLSLFIQKSEEIAKYGKNSEDYFLLLSFVLKDILNDEKASANESFKSQIKSLFTSLVASLKNTYLNITKHKNHELYLFLEDVLEDNLKNFKPQYFELNGCLKCFGNITGQYKTDTIQQLKEDLRANQNRLIIKLKKSLDIKEITVNTQGREHRYITNHKSIFKQINVYINNNLASDFAQLRTDLSQWKKVKTIQIINDVKDYSSNKLAQIRFSLPITAKFLNLEFVTHQKISYPGCSQCKEGGHNEDRQGVFCSNCGYSQLIDVTSTQINYRLAFMADAIQIENDKSKENQEKNINEQVERINNQWQELQKEMYNMKVLYDRYNFYEYKIVQADRIQINSDNIKKQYDEMMNNLLVLLAYKRSLSDYMKVDVLNSPLIQKLIHGNQSNCYGCLQSYFINLLYFFSYKDTIQCLQKFHGELYDQYICSLNEISQFNNVNQKSKYRIIKCIALATVTNMDKAKIEQIQQVGVKIFQDLQLCIKSAQQFRQIYQSCSIDIQLRQFKQLFNLLSNLCINAELENKDAAQIQTLKGLKEEYLDLIFKILPDVLREASSKQSIAYMLAVHLMEIVRDELSQKKIEEDRFEIYYQPENQYKDKLFQKYSQLQSQPQTSLNQHQIYNEEMQKFLLQTIKQGNQKDPALKKELIQKISKIQQQEQSYNSIFEAQNQVAGNQRSSDSNNEKLQKILLDNCKAIIKRALFPESSNSNIKIEKVEGPQIAQDNIIRSSLQIFNSCKLCQINESIITYISQVDKQLACEIMVLALPAALESDISATTYFTLFKNIVKSNLTTQKENNIFNQFQQLEHISLIKEKLQKQQDIMEEESKLEKNNEEEKDIIKPEGTASNAVSSATKFVEILKQLFCCLEKQLKGLGQMSILQGQDFCLLSLDRGYSLKELILIIRNLIEDKDVKLEFKKNNKLYMRYILNSVVSIRKYKMILNNHFQSIENTLSILFEQLLSDQFEEKYIFLKELIAALPNFQEDPEGQEFLLEHCYKILLPKQLPVVIKLEIHPKQNEFLPPISLLRQEYPKQEFGSTMMDILNRIKLEMTDQQFDSSVVLEMLVGNKLIVDENLPIDLVYKKVWLPSIQKPGQPVDFEKPMKVVYRIRGMDGDAVEQAVDTLDDDEEKACLELSKALEETVQLNESQNTCGIQVLLNIVKQMYKDLSAKPKLTNIVKILLTASIYKGVKQKALENDGLRTMLRLLMTYLKDYKEGESDQFIESIIAFINKLLIEADQSKFQHQNRKFSDNIDMEDDKDLVFIYNKNIKDVLNKIDKLQEKLKSRNKGQAEAMITEFTRILPLLTHNLKEPACFLIEQFEKSIEFDNLLSKQEVIKQKSLRFIEIIETLPEYFVTFRDVCIEKQILEKAMQNFVKVIPNKDEVNVKNIKNLQQNQQSIQLCLQFFKGIAKGHHTGQQILFKKGILDTIYKLTDPSIKVQDVGKHSEIIVEYLVNENCSVDTQINQYMKNLKEEDEKKKRDIINQRRLEKQKQMQQKRQVAFDLNKEQLEEIKEDKISCVVCREGYTFKPMDIIGCYIFTDKYYIPDEDKWLNDNGQIQEKAGATSVTSFNCIHLLCHINAMKGDSKQKKSEWENALIMNTEAKCNNWFPVKGPQITDQLVDDSLQKYFSLIGQINKSHSHAAWVLLNDWKGLMVKFADEINIQQETRTTYEQNIQVFPSYMAVISNYYKREEYKEIIGKVKLVLDNFVIKKQIFDNQNQIQVKSDHYYLNLVSSVFVLTHQQWSKVYLKEFFTCIIKMAGLKIQKKYQNKEDLNKEIFRMTKNSIIMLCICNQIFDKVHKVVFTDIEDIELSSLNLKLDEYLSKNYDKMANQFCDIGKNYKEDWTKIQNIEDFIAILNLESLLNGDIYQFIKQNINLAN